MTTEAINRSRPGAAPNDRDERARAAVKAFRSMQHGLTSYARAITGNSSVRVEISSGPPRTDGKVIYYRPPIRLGDKTPHQRLSCDKRDSETGLLVCPACSIREEVLVNIYHEIAHIAFGTFAPTTPRQKEDALQRAVDEWGTEYGERIKARFASAGDHDKSYMGLAGIISPFLPHLLNSLEDARVDSSMFEARKGTKKMLMADTYSLMRDGVEKDDGGRITYAELELNAQVTLGLYLSAAGYPNWQPFFHPKIGQDVADPTLQALLNGVRNATSIEQVYEASFPILARLREMGYLLMPDEQQSDDSEEQDSEESADNGGGEPTDSGESDASEPGDASPEAAPEDDSTGDGEGDSPEADGDQSDGSGEPDGDADGSSPDAGPADGDAGSEADGEGESGSDQRDGQGDDQGPQSEGTGDGKSIPEGEPEDGGLPEAGGVPEEVPGEGDGELGDEQSPDSEARGGAGGPDEQPAEDDTDERSEDSDNESGGGGSSEGEDLESTDESDSAGSEGADKEGQDDSSEGEESKAGSTAGSGDDDSDQSQSGDGSDDPSSGEGDGGEGAEREEESPLAEDQPEGSEVAPQGDGSQAGEESGEAGDDSSSDPGSESGDAGGDVGTQSRDSEGSEDDSEAGAGDPVQDDSDGPVEPIDSGADQGLGGIPLPEYGGPNVVEEITTKMHEAHEDVCQTGGSKSDDKADERSIKVAVIQGMYFETPSAHVEEVIEHTDGQGRAWYFKQELDRDDQISLGLEVDCDVPEAILGPSLLKLRRIFSDNKRANMERHRRSGHVDARVLGKRAWNGDDRLFQKKRVPGKKDYAVVISIDVSSSNLGLNLALVKRAAFAQAELLHRLGVDFAVFAHSCDLRGTMRERAFAMDIWRIKDFNQPWNPDAQRLLSDISGQGGNLDGHALEYGRKMLDESDATDKILLYYTDGKMPAANKEEELRILQREIRTCKQKRYTLLGVGIRTDSPIRHGLDTVQVDDDDDLPRVVEHLGRRLTGAAR